MVQPTHRSSCNFTTHVFPLTILAHKADPEKRASAPAYMQNKQTSTFCLVEMSAPVITSLIFSLSHTKCAHIRDKGGKSIFLCLWNVWLDSVAGTLWNKLKWLLDSGHLALGACQCVHLQRLCCSGGLEGIIPTYQNYLGSILTNENEIAFLDLRYITSYRLNRSEECSQWPQLLSVSTRFYPTKWKFYSISCSRHMQRG